VAVANFSITNPNRNAVEAVGQPAGPEPTTVSVPFLATVVGAATSLTACGGGGSGGGDVGDTTQTDARANAVAPNPISPPTLAQASRFLAQASMGANRAQIDSVVSLGYANWLDEQMAMPASGRRWDLLLDAGFEAAVNKDRQAGFDAAA
jgi:hypothetical protein